MRYFAFYNSSRQVKKSWRQTRKSICQQLKTWWQRLLLFFKYSLLVIFAAVTFSWLVWQLLPYIVQLKTDGNIVFVYQSQDGYINQILFASTDKAADKLLISFIPSDTTITYSTAEDQVQQTDQLVSVVQAMADLNLISPSPQIDSSYSRDMDSINRYWSWLLGRLISYDFVTNDIDFNEHQLRSSLLQVIKQSISQDDINFWTLCCQPQQRQKLYHNFLLYFFLRTADLDVIELESQADLWPALSSASILSGSCPVAVINCTNISGYAHNLTQILEQSGARVIRADSDQQLQALSSTAIAVNHEKDECQHLLARLEQELWLQPYIPLALEQNQALLNRYRADMVILLQEDQLLPLKAASD